MLDVAKFDIGGKHFNKKIVLFYFYFERPKVSHISVKSHKNFEFSLSGKYYTLLLSSLKWITRSSNVD